MQCEAKALAILNKNWIEKPSKALAISSLVDAVISGEETEFLAQEKEKLNSFIFLKSGKLSSDALLAYEIVEQAKNDPMFMKYLNGEHQVIMTGEINGVPVKIKIDSLHNKCIVDLKCIASFDLIFNEKTRQKEDFITHYDYILQASLYQEIVFQNTGKKLPFIIAAMTKEKISERALLNIPQIDMDAKLEEIKEYLPRLQALKKGEIEPSSCGYCDYCKSKAKVNKIYNYKDFFENRF